MPGSAQQRLWTRGRDGRTDPGGRLPGLIHHSDAGSQYVSIRYTDRLTDAGAVPSIGSIGDSYDNAQAESLIGLYKTECVRPEGPWRGVDDLELATLGWVHWSRYAGDPLPSRLHTALGYLPPIDYETEHYRHNDPRQQPQPGEPALH